MDRPIIYPGQVPLETDLLRTNRFAMTALAMLTQDVFGTTTQAAGFTCIPTGPASMAVQVTPGRLYSLQNLDGTAYSSLAADTTHQIVKQGILLDAVTLACAAPTTAGNSINYLIEATYQDTDSTLVTLPYYNSSNPTQAFSGPNNSGTPQATLRAGSVTVQAKAGISATTGSQTTPGPDAGFVGLFVVTVAFGATTVVAGNIAQASAAPFLPTPPYVGAAALAASSGAAQVGFITPFSGGALRTLQSKARDFVSVKDFGALGDGSGATPASQGVTIMAQPWNTWNGNPLKTNLANSPYGTTAVFVPPTAQPFQDTDTWDYIGCQLALWSGAKSIYFPEGTFVINLTAARPNGLIRMTGQESTMFGAGTYETKITTSNNAAFFAANNVGVADFYKLIWNYRVTGTPSTIRDMCLIGPTGYTQASQNLTLSCGSNMNGVTHRDLWITSAARGITGDTSTSDCHISRVTAEFLFDAVVNTDVNSEFSIDFCNFWSSAQVAGQKGVNALGRVAITNSRFMEFQAGAVIAATGVFVGNTVRCLTGGAASAVNFGSNSVYGNNDVEGAMGSALVQLGSKSSAVGGRIKVTSQQPALNLGNGTASSAGGCTVSNMVLTKTDNTAGAQNFLITALLSGVDFTSAATSSTMISGCIQTGNAMAAVGLATMRSNSINNVVQPDVFANAVTLAGDVTGNIVASGTSAAASFPVVMPMIGSGSGAIRDQQRLMLVSLYSSGTAHIVRGWALYTSSSSGAAVLVSTLGSTATGGTITFGVTGNNPSATITNTGGGTATYQASAVALV